MTPEVESLIGQISFWFFVIIACLSVALYVTTSALRNEIKQLTKRFEELTDKKLEEEKTQPEDCEENATDVESKSK